jgi:4-amino-4-deoxy-L-arabinose transferase-like glycosyltransferase
MIKGPVVFVPTALPVLAVAVWEGVRRLRAPGTPRVTSWLGPPRGWLAFVAIALPWFIAIVVIVPGLLEYLLRTQLWQRYTSGVHHREGAWWYFIAVLLGGLAPWTPALFAGFLSVWRKRSERDARLLIAWLVAPLVFFSFSGSKLPAYLPPQRSSRPPGSCRAAARWRSLLPRCSVRSRSPAPCSVLASSRSWPRARRSPCSDGSRSR